MNENKYTDYFYEMVKREEAITGEEFYQGAMKQEVDFSMPTIADVKNILKEDYENISDVDNNIKTEMFDTVKVEMKSEEDVKMFEGNAYRKIDDENQRESDSSGKSDTSRNYESMYIVNVMSEKYNQRSFKSKYTCKLCDNSFQYKSDILKHLIAHETGLKCDSCAKVYKKKSQLIRHMATHNKKFSPCCYCNVIFEEEELLNHLPIHFEEPTFECDLCNMTFNDEDSLQDHMVEHSTPSEGEKEDNNVIVLSDDDSGQGNSSIILDEEEEKYSCDQCGGTYTTFKRLRRHRRLMHSAHFQIAYKCRICSKVFQDEVTLKRHEGYHSRNKFFCESCNIYFKFSRNLEKHIETTHNKSTSIKPVPESSDVSLRCEKCGKGFINSRLLKQHQVHHQQDRFKCDQCERSYKYEFDLKRHKKIKHGSGVDSNCNNYETKENEDGKKYKCKICKKKFLEEYVWKRHLSVHSNERPFECDICNKKYKNKSSLIFHNRHIKCVRRSGLTLPAEEKSKIINPYQCNICKEEYSNINLLEEHVKSHVKAKPENKPKKNEELFTESQSNKQDFMCLECDTGFISEEQLKLHSVRHYKPFECNICDKTFSTQQVLKSHMDTHFDTERVECDICRNSFKNKKSLYTHRLYQHKVK